MKLTDRDNTDYDTLQDIISEVYEQYGYDDFMHGNSLVDLADDVLHIINENPDYRYLRFPRRFTTWIYSICTRRYWKKYCSQRSLWYSR